MSPIASPDPLWATALVRKRSSRRVFVNRIPVSAGEDKRKPAWPSPTGFKGTLLTAENAVAPQTIGMKQSERQVPSHPPRNMLANRPEPGPLVNKTSHI